MRGTRDIDRRVTTVLTAYRTWRSPKTAAKRQADYQHRVSMQAAHLKALEDRR